MKWKGTVFRTWAEQEVKFDNRSEIPVVAFITHHDGQFDFQVYDIDPRGNYSAPYIRPPEWTKSLAWAKRKCKDAVANTASEWEWEQIE